MDLSESIVRAAQSNARDASPRPCPASPECYMEAAMKTPIDALNRLPELPVEPNVAQAFPIVRSRKVAS